MIVNHHYSYWQFWVKTSTSPILGGAVMAIYSSYNWLFRWDNKQSINGVTC